MKKTQRNRPAPKPRNMAEGNASNSLELDEVPAEDFSVCVEK